MVMQIKLIVVVVVVVKTNCADLSAPPDNWITGEQIKTGAIISDYVIDYVKPTKISCLTVHHFVLEIHRQSSQRITTEQASQLKAEQVTLHKKENRQAHKTDEYEIELLILRRGQAFDVTVTFNRDYNPDTDVITVQFVTGKNPQQNKGGIVRVQIRDALVLSKWGMQVKEANGNTVRLSIMSSAQAAIGYYDVMVETKSKDSSGEESLYRYKHEEQICILFNAWCLEYVLKEKRAPLEGQLEKNFKNTLELRTDVALNCALWLLSEKANLSSKAMSNVVHVARTMTSMVNSADIGGVLQGRWEETYPEGTAPWEWSGSIAILEEFWKTKKVVKYGQCWVFSGVLTSLLRALGIPTRSVTNFQSAHDTEKSLTIDYFFDANGRPTQPDPYYKDSVWNFHVWNECWFKRLDLPDGHDGWQAVDGTPQESSEGVYQCGPASVNAIRNGEVYLNYDTDFIFSEVNADKVYWEAPSDSGELRVIQIDHHSVGKSISTQKPGKVTERRDLTQHYKQPEGSEEERRVVEFVHRFSTRQDLQIYGPAERDVTSRLDVVDEVKLGEPFKATAIVKNESNEKRTVTGHLTAILVFYTGRAARTIKEAEDTIILEPGEEKSVVLDISFPELLGKSIADCSVKVFLKGSVHETDQRFAVQDIVEFIMPELEVTFSGADNVKLNEEVTVTVSLTNPLPMDLTNGKFHFEFNLMKPRTLVVDCKGPVRVDEKKEVTVTFLAVKRSGFRNLSVNFNSAEVTGVVGESYVLVY
ncbi:hypothetical protein OS493_029696 [Desmophyllum pertusum]|uniref:Transglutaminase-like domain-containing protein n=1 Tax=Desmophyllum pertusum TaxID=174260 RepID=A0A9X0CV98_9CNID|nr:hypothetical protein OS493_029696 [Desmophyllum pertusum]